MQHHNLTNTVVNDLDAFRKLPESINFTIKRINFQRAAQFAYVDVKSFIEAYKKIYMIFIVL